MYSFDLLLAEHAAPVLAGMKTANLITCRREWYPNLPEMLTIYQQAFAARGVRFRILCACDYRFLLLVYRPERLLNDLASKQARVLLHRYEYPMEQGLDALLEHLSERIVRNAQSKKPCQPKTAKRFFGGPGSHGPSGQAKERTRVLPVRRGFSAPNVPRHVAGWSFLRGLPLLWRLLCTVPRLFSAGMPLPCSRLVGCLILLRLVWSALPLPAMRLCARFFFCLLPFSA